LTAHRSCHPICRICRRRAASVDRRLRPRPRRSRTGSRGGSGRGGHRALWPDGVRSSASRRVADFAST